MYKALFIFLSIALLVVSMVTIASCDAVAEGSVALSYSEVIDDKSAGVVADYNFNLGIADFELDGDIQFGNVIRSKFHGEVVFPISVVGIKISADTTAKGYDFEGLGLDTNLSAGITVPVKELNFDVGIGGKSASPWAAPDAFDYLVSGGYGEQEAVRGVAKAPRGLPFQDGQFLQIYAQTGFEKWDVNVDLKGIAQVTGEDKADQLQAFLEWENDMGPFNLTLGYEVGLMKFRGVKDIHYETAAFTTFGLRF